MGNTAAKRESRDVGALSPTREVPPNSFDFKPNKGILTHGSIDDTQTSMMRVCTISVKVISAQQNQ